MINLPETSIKNVWANMNVYWRVLLVIIATTEMLHIVPLVREPSIGNAAELFSGIAATLLVALILYFMTVNQMNKMAFIELHKAHYGKGQTNA